MAKKKPARKAAAKKPVKRPSTAKKAARKAAAKSPRKAAAKKGARKAAAKKGARKLAAKAPKRAVPRARKPAARKKVAKAAPAPTAIAADESEEEEAGPRVEQVETTSAGIQPLAPEHAAVDELTSSGNELLDIFQKYDRNRTGYIEAAEFARLLEALGQNNDEMDLQIALDSIGVGPTGKISWMQFKSWWASGR